jgi:hypothetical protein
MHAWLPPHIATPGARPHATASGALPAESANHCIFWCKTPAVLLLLLHLLHREVYRCMQNSSAGGTDVTLPEPALAVAATAAAAAAAGGDRLSIQSSPRVSTASIATTGSTAAEVAAMARAGRLALERMTAAAAAEHQAARPWRQQQQQRLAVKSRRPQLRSGITKAGAGPVGRLRQE